MKKWIGLAGGAVLLLYLTLSMAPDGPPAGAAHSAVGAGDACKAAVEAENPTSSFPLSPTVTYDAPRYAVRGVLDTPSDGATTRRNYECAVTFDTSAGYLIDSLSVWQSH